MYTFLADVEQGRQCSAFLFQLSYCKQCPFQSAMFFTFLCFSLEILLCKWPTNVVLKC